MPLNPALIALAVETAVLLACSSLGAGNELFHSIVRPGHKKTTLCRGWGEGCFLDWEVSPPVQRYTKRDTLVAYTRI
jgi:hypothetical protein